jgi:heat shock transcription factor, other eukaryote
LTLVMSNPRKRAAPGAAPVVAMPPPQQPFSPAQPDRVYGWNGPVEDVGFVDANPPNGLSIMSPPGQYGQPVQSASTALARRQNNNRALVHPVVRPQFEPGSEGWTTSFPEDTSFLPQAPGGGLDEGDSIERLEERAARAKREAQAKRKQIPPFVQKLSRYAGLSNCISALD